MTKTTSTKHPLIRIILAHQISAPPDSNQYEKLYKSLTTLPLATLEVLERCIDNARTGVNLE